MARPSRYSPELKDRAVRMVLEHAAEHLSQWAAIEAIAPKLGCTSETLRTWVRQGERDAGQRPGLTTEERERLKGLQGAVRGRAWVTTTRPAPATDRPADLVDRNFAAPRPNQLWVSDFTYVATWAGFVYVAFVIDVFARRIVGWRVSASLRTDFVLDALEQAHLRPPRRSTWPGWSITAIAAPSICRCGTPTAWPMPASPRPWAAAGIPTTTPSPNP